MSVKLAGQQEECLEGLFSKPFDPAAGSTANIASVSEYNSDDGKSPHRVNIHPPHTHTHMHINMDIKPVALHMYILISFVPDSFTPAPRSPSG